MSPYFGKVIKRERVRDESVLGSRQSRLLVPCTSRVNFAGLKPMYCRPLRVEVDPKLAYFSVRAHQSSTLSYPLIIFYSVTNNSAYLLALDIATLFGLGQD